MAVAVLAAAAGQITGGTPDLPLPRSPRAGEVMVAVLCTEANPGQLVTAAPAGWELLARAQGGNFDLTMWGRVAALGDEGLTATGAFALAQGAFSYLSYHTLLLQSPSGLPANVAAGVGLTTAGDDYEYLPAFPERYDLGLAVVMAVQVGAKEPLELVSGVNMPLNASKALNVYSSQSPVPQGLSLAVDTSISDTPSALWMLFGVPVDGGIDLISLDISEDMSGFVDSRLTLRTARTRALDPAERHVVGSSQKPAEALRRFFVQTALPRGDGLREYQGETLLSRMARTIPKKESLLIRRAPERTPGDPASRWWHPEEVLALVLDSWKPALRFLDYEPLPVVAFRGEGGALIRPRIEAIAMYDPRTQQGEAGENVPRRSMREWLDELTRPFLWAGYFWRENSAGRLELVPPHWVGNPAPVELADRDVGLNFEPTNQSGTVINRVTVSSQGYEFAEQPDVMREATFQVWPFFPPGLGGRPGGGRLDYPDDIPGAPPDPFDAGDIYNLSPLVELQGLNRFVQPFTATQSLTLDSPSPVGDDGLEVTIRVQRWYYAIVIDEFGQLEDLTVTASDLPRGVETFVGELGGLWKGPLAGLNFVSLQVWLTRTSDTNIDIRIQGSLSNDYLALYGVEEYVYGIRLMVSADGRTWQPAAEKNIETRGDAEVFPDFDALRDAYGVVERDYDTGIYQLSAADCNAIALGVVRENYRPRPLYEFELIPPYELLPDDLGKLVVHPSGMLGVLESWRYSEQNGPAQVVSKATAQIRVFEQFAVGLRNGAGKVLRNNAGEILEVRYG